jgi:hypothetical protein
MYITHIVSGTVSFNHDAMACLPVPRAPACGSLPSFSFVDGYYEFRYQKDTNQFPINRDYIATCDLPSTQIEQRFG